MEWQIIIAVLVVIPVILFPVALTWYLNSSAVASAIKDSKNKRAISETEIKTGA